MDDGDVNDDNRDDWEVVEVVVDEVEVVIGVFDDGLGVERDEASREGVLAEERDFEGIAKVVSRARFDRRLNRNQSVEVV